MFQVNVSARSVSPFVELVGAERVESVTRRAALTSEMLGSRAVWNINSTVAGGGVAEMLRSLLRYARGLGVDVRWTVLQGPPAFFQVTKRVHNALHDDPGDGSPLGREQAALYERVIAENIAELDQFVRPGDVVICHDPQTAGLVPHLARRNVRVVWRCHIGHDGPGREVDQGWAFLRKYLEDVPIAVFSRDVYAPGWLPRKRAAVLPPNIDPFSTKNQWMPDLSVHAILSALGLVEQLDSAPPLFVRDDGSTGRVMRTAEVFRVGRAPAWSTPLVVQVGRWDRMKDPVGVLHAFARLVSEARSCGAELVLAGPTVRGVVDDPEAPAVFEETMAAWKRLPDAVRRITHLAQLPMDDTEENAAIVNALQRHATVILQKSIHEGFGLTVTEAMWKRRPVVSTAVGGIQDQIRDGIDGLLISKPTDLEETANAIERVLASPELAERLGEAAYARVRDNYLSISSLERWADLIQLLVEGGPVATTHESAYAR